jgi:Na+/melibiose symporter-like transporter
MSKHKLIFAGVIFLIVVLVVLVYCFFEKRERVIEESIKELETAGTPLIIHHLGIQVSKRIRNES